MKTLRPWMIGLLLCLCVIGSFFYVSKHAQTAPVIVSGSVALEPDLEKEARYNSHIFVVLFDEESPMPMPYAAARYKLTSEPKAGTFFSFFLTEQNTQIMNPGRKQPKKLRVKVRLDADGVAGADKVGDITGELRSLPWGSENVRISLNNMKRS